MNQQTHMLRGDWLINALTAIHKGQTHWTPIPTTPTHLTTRTPGRFHLPTKTWWTEARETTNTPPLHTTIYSPPETRINYPGETWIITPTWIRTLINTLHEDNTLNAFHSYVENPTSNIAYYSDTHAKVIWGNHPHALRQATLTASNHMPYNPNGEKPNPKNNP